ncbi:MAG: OmpA family protein [Bacteroidales bacterium]|nr:OmpA family protein [Bacteroidales bacterium]
MASKVRVYGKAQNRTALGIMHAYMLMYPQATIEDLRKAFPNSLNPDKGVQENFIFAEEKGTDANWDGYFKGNDEVLLMGDGKKVAVVKMWTKASFDRVVEQAKLYDIEVAKFEAAEKGFGKKGGFTLEYLNGWTPPAPVAKKRKLLPILLIAALVIIALLFLILKPSNKEVVVKEVEKVVTVVDTVFIQQVEDIEKNFNAANFAQGKSELSEDAKFVLHDLAKILEKQPDMRLKIVGHTSAEGDADLNQKLSEARAKAAVDFLVSKGIDASRLQYEGKGSAEQLDPNNPDINRRTEFIVLN